MAVGTGKFSYSQRDRIFCKANLRFFDGYFAGFAAAVYRNGNRSGSVFDGSDRSFLVDCGNAFFVGFPFGCAFRRAGDRKFYDTFAKK